VKKVPVTMFLYFMALLTAMFVGGRAMAQALDNPQMSTQADFSSYDRLQYNWSIDTGAINYAEAQDQSQLVYVQLRPKLHYSLVDDLKLNSEINFFLTTERAQSRFYNPSFNFINIIDLSLTYKPVELFAVTAGALNHNNYDNPMFIRNRSFPGLKIESGVLLKDSSVHVNVQESIPISASYESDRTKAEKLPTLSTIGLKLNSTYNWLQFKANYNYFKYQNLPSVVAFQSGTQGNETIGTESSEASFIYQFQGYTLANNLIVNYSNRFKHSFDLKIIDNLKAPESRRRSQWVGTALEFDINNISFSPGIATFFAESDSVPAIYSQFQLGRNNRKGMEYSFKVDFKKYDFALSATYEEANLIQQKALQQDMRYLEINLEVRSDIL
jgi:hypothetical protein